MLKKIVSYEIVHSHSVRELSEKVNELIDADWQPYGEPYPFAGEHHQPMVKYGHESDE